MEEHEARADPDSCGTAGVPPLARAASQGNAKVIYTNLMIDLREISGVS